MTSEQYSDMLDYLQWLATRHHGKVSCFVWIAAQAYLNYELLGSEYKETIAHETLATHV